MHTAARPAVVTRRSPPRNCKVKRELTDIGRGRQRSPRRYPTLIEIDGLVGPQDDADAVGTPTSAPPAA